VIMEERQTLKFSLVDWITLARPPFHTVGALPFILGAVLAHRTGNVFHLEVFLYGLAAVILIMLSTYQLGEFFDQREDRISRAVSPSRFAGGSGVMPTGRVAAAVPLWSGIASFVMAGLIGLILQFHYRTGPYTLFIGAVGALAGFFYSTRPVRIVERGLGEILIGFCYGWLPVAAAFYLQTGYLHEVIHWIAVPIGFSIFNVILLNEFPDYEADRATGKRNLLVRVGRDTGRVIYATIAILSWPAVLLSVQAGVPVKVLYPYLLVFLLSLTLVVMAARRLDRDRRLLEGMCGLNIGVNLGTTACYIFAYL